VQSFQFLSLHPRIIVFPNFINNAKATRFIKLAEARMIQSSLALRKGETVEGKKGLSPQNNMHTNQHSYTRQSGIPTTHFKACSKVFWLIFRSLLVLKKMCEACWHFGVSTRGPLS
jgi:hypothetical protein